MEIIGVLGLGGPTYLQFEACRSADQKVSQETLPDCSKAADMSVRDLADSTMVTQGSQGTGPRDCKVISLRPAESARQST